MQLREAELLEDFADRGIVAVKRFKKRTEGGITDTPIHLLTFDSLNPPTHIYHGWVKYYTRRYIPKPRQCFKCFKFGHIAGVCRGLEQLCINCATTGHKPTECKNETRCSQCGEGHISTSRNCKHYKLHNRIQELKEIKRLSHKDAFTQAKTELGLGIKTYSRAAQQNIVRQPIGISIPRHTRTSENTHREHTADNATRNFGSNKSSPNRGLQIQKHRVEVHKTHDHEDMDTLEYPGKNSSKIKGKKMKRIPSEEIVEADSSDGIPSPTKRKISAATKERHVIDKKSTPTRKENSRKNSTEKTASPSRAHCKSSASPTRFEEVESTLAALDGGETSSHHPLIRTNILDLPWPHGHKPPPTEIAKQSQGKNYAIEVVTSLSTPTASQTTNQTPRDPRIRKNTL